MTDPLHDDELTLDVPLVRALVDRAMPEYATRPLRRLRSSGSSNALFRLGQDLLVRLPRQPGGSAAIDKEARWLPRIGPLLPTPTPTVVAVGEPDLGYTERWSVVRWLDGTVPSVAWFGSEDRARPTLARDLAAVITALGSIAVPDSAHADPDLRWYRGAPLRTRDAATRQDIETCRTIADLDLDLDAALRVWEQVIDLPDDDHASTSRWYHGDLLAENMLVHDGRLSAVLDFGGLGIGDPTIDLVAAWEILDASSREDFRHALDLDDHTWLRGRGWALSLALMTFPYYWRTMPDRCGSRLAMARSVLADAAMA